MKKWIIALIFVFACLPVVAIKAAPPQTYIHLDYEIEYIPGEYYHIGDGLRDGVPGGGWVYSTKIQIPKNVDKLYFSDWHTHFILFFNDKTYIGFYYDEEIVFDVNLPGTYGADKKVLGTYSYADDFIHMLDVPTGATHIVLQTCYNVTAELGDYMDDMPISFNYVHKPLIYYPAPADAAPADAAANLTFNLMPALMIMIVIAGLVGGLIMITKKSKR